MGESGMEALLSLTIDAAVCGKAVKAGELKRVTVDSTVQEKAIAFSTDARLYNRARERLVRLAKNHGIDLRQSYVRVGPRLLLQQQRTDKHKLYAMHAPEVECIAKGKAHKRYEFGVKASFAVTNRSNLVVGAKALPGNPYDGHTLEEALQQVTRLTGVKPERCYVDLGYRGHQVKDVQVYKARQKRGITPGIRRELKRRNAIEPIIGHMKSDGLLHRNHLKGSLGDAINVILCGAGQNLRLILRHLRIVLPEMMAKLRQGQWQLHRNAF